MAGLRRKKGLSLDQIAENTKIGVRYLEAIEGGNFGKLPGGFYDISYIRQYAQAVQHDAADLLLHYRDAIQVEVSAAAANCSDGLLNVSMPKLRKA